MTILQQSVSYIKSFYMVDSNDHRSGKTGVSSGAFTVNISKNGGVFGSAGGAVSEIASGWYKITLSSGNLDTLGDLAVDITATGCDKTYFVEQVTAGLPADMLKINGSLTSDNEAVLKLKSLDIQNSDFAGVALNLEASSGTAFYAGGGGTTGYTPIHIVGGDDGSIKIEGGISIEASTSPLQNQRAISIYALGDDGSGIYVDSTGVALTLESSSTDALKCIPGGSGKPINGDVILAAAGLDKISISAPTGAATTFGEMVVQLWRRFFKKTTMDTTSLKTYADDGSTVLTSQLVSETNSIQTQGPAS